MKFPSPYEKILPADIPCVWPPLEGESNSLNDHIRGSMLGLAVGDALGASVEFQPHEELLKHPVRKMQSGGTWGLEAGQWTDDTSMALCLASSLITTKTFDPYNQMVLYKWWYKYGFFSSTGRAFDIGRSTKKAINEFIRRQQILKNALGQPSEKELDHLPFNIVRRINASIVNCGQHDAAGNGALMRLAPIALYFFRNPILAVENAGQSTLVTHGSEKAVDACRYFAALIVAILRGETKQQLLSNQFYNNHRVWFGLKDLCKDVHRIAMGSYKKPGGYSMGIKGTGYVINSLEAALWAFWSDGDSFKKGVLAAVNLGNDTDTTAAIYGQLAGAYYGAHNIPTNWLKKLYAKDLIMCISDWLQYLGRQTYSKAVIQDHMFHHVPIQSDKRYSKFAARKHNKMFQQFVPSLANQLEIYDIQPQHKLPSYHAWTSSPAFVGYQYQQQVSRPLLSYPRIGQSQYYVDQFYNIGHMYTGTL